MRIRSSVRTAAALALVAAALLAVEVAGAEPGLGALRAMPDLVGSPRPSTAVYGAVSCDATLACVAVGPSIVGAAGGRPSVVTQSGSAWSKATAIMLPPGGVAASSSPAVLNGVSCPSLGGCVAVGTYPTSLGAVYPMVAEQAGSAWHRAVGLSLPAGAVVGGLSAVSCAAPGRCVALGYDATSATTVRTTAYDLAFGVWSAPVTLPAPTGNVVPVALSCPSASTCVGVGIEESSSGTVEGSVAWQQVAGRWHAPDELHVAGGGAFAVTGVACPTPTTCLAVGGIDRGSATYAAVATDSAGAWGSTVRLATPRLSPVSPLGDLTSVACGAASVCEAVGHFGASTRPGAPGVAASLTWDAGTWSTVGFAAAVPGADDAAFGGVACPTAEACEAVGAVAGPGADPAVSPVSATLTPVRAVVAPDPPASVTVTPSLHGARVTWSPPVDDGGAAVVAATATLSARAGTCTSSGSSCTIAGLVVGRRYAVSVTDRSTAGTSSPSAPVAFVAGTPPTRPTGLRATVGSGVAAVSWRPSTVPTGESVTGYDVHAMGTRGDAHRCTSAVTRCTLRRLVDGERYVVRVTAADLSGTSPTSSPLRLTAR